MEVAASSCWHVTSRKGMLAAPVKLICSSVRYCDCGSYFGRCAAEPPADADSAADQSDFRKYLDNPRILNDLPTERTFPLTVISFLRNSRREISRLWRVENRVTFTDTVADTALSFMNRWKYGNENLRSTFSTVPLRNPIRILYHVVETKFHEE